MEDFVYFLDINFDMIDIYRGIKIRIYVLIVVYVNCIQIIINKNIIINYSVLNLEFK